MRALNDGPECARAVLNNDDTNPNKNARRISREHKEPQQLDTAHSLWYNVCALRCGLLKHLPPSTCPIAMPLLPTSRGAATALVACTFLAWGHWPIFQRMCKPKSPQAFFLAMVLYQTACCVLICLTAGNVSGSFWAALAADVAADHGAAALALAALGGGALAVGEFLTTIAINALGVAVGAPMIWSLALIGGMGADYLIAGGGRLGIMLAGMGVALIAFLADSQSHPGATEAALPLTSDLATGSTSIKAEQATGGIKAASSSTWRCELPTASDGLKPTPATSWTLRRADGGGKLLLLAAVGGMALACWTALSTLAVRVLPTLGPYSLLLAFQLGEAACTLPVLLAYSRADPRSPRSVRALLQGVRGLSGKGHAGAAAAGCAISVGYWCYFITRGVIPRSIAYGVSQACGVVGMLYGAFIFGEFAAAPRHKTALLGIALVCYPTAVALMALSL